MLCPVAAWQSIHQSFALSQTQSYNISPLRSPTPMTIVLLAATAALGQFAFNIHAPSLPAIAAELDVSVLELQTSFVVYLVSQAIGMLLLGPLADRYGRRPLLIFGFTVFLAGSAICAVATSNLILLCARVLQAFGAASVFVVSRAMTRDRFDGADLAKVLAWTAIAFGLAPGFAPAIGGIAENLFGWRSVFWLITGLGGLLACFSLLQLRETLTGSRRRGAPTSVVQNFRIVASDGVYVSYSLAASFVLGTIFVFFTASPDLYIEQLGVPTDEYGFYPLLASLAFVCGCFTAVRLSGTHGQTGIMISGFVILTAAIAAMLGLAAMGLGHKHMFTLTTAVGAFGLGVFHPIAIASALQRCSEHAATAASVQGFLQVIIGAGCAFTVGIVQPALPNLAMPLAMIGAVTLAAVAFASAMRLETRQ